MKKILRGFQCEKCKSIYATKEKATLCEKQPLEEPILKIGDTLIDDSYDVESEIRVCGIYFVGHEVNYRMEWKTPISNGEWDELYTIFGNEELINYKGVR